MECVNVSSTLRLDSCASAGSLPRRAAFGDAPVQVKWSLAGGGAGGGVWKCGKWRGRGAVAAASSSPAAPAAPLAAEDVDRVGSLSQVSGVLGCQWGDEGKGKLVDILAKHFDVVARCQVLAPPRSYQFSLRL